jgi:YggT family protein
MFLIRDLLSLFLLVLISYSILSWITMAGRMAPDSPVVRIQRGLSAICEPVLRPVRRIVPPVQVGGVGLDLSVLVVFLVVEVLINVI